MENSAEQFPTDPVEMLEFVRDRWSDKIPGTVVDSTSRELTKARTAWWMMIRLGLDLLIDDGLITDKELLERVRIFGEKVVNRGGDHLTTKEEIKEANEVIDDVLSHVKK